MKIAYSLPFLLLSSCRPSLEPLLVPLEVSFPDYSWSLSWEQMKELRIFSGKVSPGSTVSLESCARDGEHFQKQRAQSIEYFLVQGNPLDVQVEVCTSKQEKTNTVYVSVL